MKNNMSLLASLTTLLLTLGIGVSPSLAVEAPDTNPPASTDSALEVGGALASVAGEVPSGFILPTVPNADVQASSTSILDTDSGLRLDVTSVDMGQVANETAFGAQLIFKLKSNTTDPFTFEIGHQDGGIVTLVTQSGGGIALRQNGVLLGVIAVPWAFDANGNSVATHFEIEGTSIRQIVDTGAGTVFPVTADPSLITVVGCITALGFGTASAIASGGLLTASDAVAISLCYAAMEADRAAVAKKRSEVASLTSALSAVQSDIARLQAANGEFARVLSDPKASASSKSYARSQISNNNLMIAEYQKRAKSYQDSIASLNAEIADLSYWP